MNAKVRYPSIETALPRGRLVRGSLTEKQTKNHKNEPLPPDDHHYWFAIAVPKTAPGLAEAWGKIYQHVYQSYMTVPGSQSVIQRIQQGLQVVGFAWKIDDGDTDPVWSKREGCPGTLIFQFKTMYDVATFDNANRQLDPKVFKLGDYVDVYLSTAINGEIGHTAGIHMNPRGVRWLEEGQRIHIGPDANAMFGAPIGGGYQGHQQAAPMPSSVMAPAPAPLHSHMPPAGGAPIVSAATIEPADQQAARLGIQYYPGFRLDEGTRTYVPDIPAAQPPAPPVPNPAPSVGGAPAPAYGSGGVGVAPGSGFASGQPAYGSPTPAYPNHVAAPAAPAGAPGFPAPSVAPGGQGGIASPSNPYSPHNPPPAPPVPGFAGGAPRIA